MPFQKKNPVAAEGKPQRPLHSILMEPLDTGIVVIVNYGADTIEKQTRHAFGVIAKAMEWVESLLAGA